MCMYRNTVSDSVMLYIQYHFYNIILKIKQNPQVPPPPPPAKRKILGARLFRNVGLIVQTHTSYVSWTSRTTINFSRNLAYLRVTTVSSEIINVQPTISFGTFHLKLPQPRFEQRTPYKQAEVRLEGNRTFGVIAYSE
jgi:hypothetical protein